MTDSESEDVMEDPGDVLRYVDYDSLQEGTTLARLNTMRKGGHLCDVILEVGNHSVPAHRAILACASNYLFHLFSAEDGTSVGHFQLQNVDYESFDILVNFAYTSRLEVPADRVKAVYKAAMMLKFQGAAQACANYLAQHLEPNNCLGIRAFVNSLCDSWLTSKTDTFIQQHMDQIPKSPELKNLPGLQIDLLGVDEADLMSQEGVDAVCLLAVEWAQKNLEKHPMEQLTKHLHKLYLAPDNTLRDCQASEDHLLNNSDEVKDYRKLHKFKQVVADVT